MPPSTNPVCNRTGATEQQEATILARIRGSAGVKTVAYESKAQALAKFRAMFKGNPGLLASTPPEAIPDSYRVRRQTSADPSKIAKAIHAFPGVDQVVITEPHDHHKILVASPRP